MKTLFKEFLHLGRGERSAFLSLIFLILILLVFRLWLADLLFKPDQKELLALINSVEIIPESNVPEIKASEETIIKYSSFDPNTASKEQFHSNGLPEFLSNRIINFRNAGGKFYQPEDLLKVYGFTQEQLNLLRPYIQIRINNHKVNREPEKTFKREKEIIPVIKLNDGDSATFTKLPGIGPVLAGRIIRYRDFLGGYLSIEQLKEVYGIQESTFENIKKYLRNDSINIEKLSINSKRAADLAKHPYISYETAWTIIRYREQHGDFKDLGELTKIHTLSDSLINRISPYLKTD